MRYEGTGVSRRWIPMEETDVYRRASELSDQIYFLVKSWDMLASKTLGEQLIRSVDSIAANLVEGDGAGTPKDSSRFIRYARNSGREARHWLRRAYHRDLMDEDGFESMLRELTEVVKMVNGLLKRRSQLRVHEYGSESEDPFCDQAN